MSPSSHETTSEGGLQDQATAEGRHKAKQKSFRRGYVACIPCRTRKVRCVLDADPPCAKCRREHRQCVFEDHHKSSRHRDPPQWTRRTESVGQLLPQTVSSSQVGHPPDVSVGAASSAQSYQSHKHAMPSVPQQLTPSNTSEHRLATSPASTNHSLAETLLSTVMTRPGNALDVLFDAAQSRPTQPSAEMRTTVAHLGEPATVCTSPQVTGNAPQFHGSAITRLSVPSNETLDLWDKSRFVRQGLVTAQELVTYLDLFFEHIAPMTPVLSDHYRDHASHYSLIHEEALLCCTILMISSRFFTLPGAGGISRSHHAHQRFWNYCEHLIRRVMFGQEKLSSARTRVVGTIESLVLISDWHPRSIHFPPDAEGWDVLLIQPEYDRTNRLVSEGNEPLIRWKEDVFEPARRAERMSWMLLGAATNLAYELGILTDDLEAAQPDTFTASRYARAKQVLSVYVSYQAVKLSCSSMLPQNISNPSLAISFDLVNSVSDKSWRAFMQLWIDLTQLMKTASAMFFQSKSQTRQQLLNGHYSILLQHFSPSLTSWYDRYAVASADLSDAAKDLLFIEFQHLKIYTGALSIQAVVERALARGISATDKSQADVFKACVLTQDWKFIRDVVADSCKILEKATFMAQAGRLRYTPMRTLVCITTASVLLLKALTLGTQHTDLGTALRILDDSIAALRSSAIDDMDFSPRYATLMEKHVARFRANYTVPHSPNRSEGGSQASVPSLPQDPSRKDLSMEQLLPEPGGIGGEEVYRGDFEMLDPYQFPIGDDDWATRPFDPSVAPFGAGGDHLSLGFELDTLDFLWNLPDPSSSS